MGSLWAFANCVFGLCLFVFSLVDSLLAFAVFAVYMFWTCCGQIVVVFKYGALPFPHSLFVTFCQVRGWRSPALLRHWKPSVCSCHAAGISRLADKRGMFATRRLVRFPEDLKKLPTA